MKSKILTAGVLVLASSDKKCEPSGREYGAAALLALPIAFVVALGLNALLRAAWRASKGTLPRKRLVHLIAVLGLLGLAVAASRVGVTSDDGKASVWVFGSSYLTFYLVIWRFQLSLAPQRAFTWAPIWALLVAAPALPMIWLNPNTDTGLWPLVMNVWVFGGVFGALPTLLFIIFMMEGYVARRPTDR